ERAIEPIGAPIVSGGGGASTCASIGVGLAVARLAVGSHPHGLAGGFAARIAGRISTLERPGEFAFSGNGVRAFLDVAEGWWFEDEFTGERRRADRCSIPQPA